MANGQFWKFARPPVLFFRNRITSVLYFQIILPTATIPPEGLPSENPIVLDLDNHDASGTLTEDWLPLFSLSSHSRSDSFPRISGRSASSQQGVNIMKTLLILRKDGNGTFRWVEAVNDVDTAEARVRRLCAESQGTMRKIVDFHLDENLDWVAELECGHEQHVRHNPPFYPRPLGDNAARTARTSRQELNLSSR